MQSKNCILVLDFYPALCYNEPKACNCYLSGLYIIVRGVCYETAKTFLHSDCGDDVLITVVRTDGDASGGGKTAAGDINGDGAVTVIDLIVLQIHSCKR